jgi:hypothetical protein
VSTTRKPPNDQRPQFPSSRTLQTLIQAVHLSVLTLPLQVTAADQAHSQSRSIRPRVDPSSVVDLVLTLFPTPTFLQSLDLLSAEAVDPVLIRSPTPTRLQRTRLSVVADPDRTLFQTPTLLPRLDPLVEVDLVPTLSRFPQPHRLAHP